MAPELTLTVADSLDSVRAELWDRLTGSNHPFVEHAFLRSLETSGCVGGESGWYPRYLLLWRGAPDAARLVGAAPAYAKANSYGEYIFDWSWADAAQRSGIRYYPKLVVGVPFTPATGPRMLVEPGPEAASLRQVLARGARQLAQEQGMSSVHWLFVEEEELEALTSSGYRQRASYQFHFHNRDWATFEDFLGALRSRRRKEIRRERRRAASTGLDLAVERGSDLTTADWQTLFTCYLNTLEDKWGRPYLTLDWFMGMGERLGHRAVVSTARRDGALVAGALAFEKGDALYGRYWGATEHHDALHFELCYYQLIEHALQTGLARFEAGAQGQQKLARGFLPQRTHSAHWIRHTGLFDAVADFLVHEAEEVDRVCASLTERGPFCRG